MTKLIKERKAKADGRITINVSFTPNEYDLINHVDKNSNNFSQYLKDLIVADMNNTAPAVTLERINKLIEAGDIIVTLKDKQND